MNSYLLKSCVTILILVFISTLISAQQSSKDDSSGDSSCLLTVTFFVGIPLFLILISIFSAVNLLKKDSYSDEGVHAKMGVMYPLLGVFIIFVGFFCLNLFLESPIPLFECVGFAQGQVSDQLGMPIPEEKPPIDYEFHTPEIILFSGWNLISTPLILDDPNISHAFLNVNFSVIRSFRPDICNGDWKENESCWPYKLKNGSGELNVLELDRSYWIHVNENTSVAFTGRIPQNQRNISLSPGWNLVSYIGERSISPHKLFQNVIFSSVYTWDQDVAHKGPYQNGWSGMDLAKGDQKLPPLPYGFKSPDNVRGPSRYLTEMVPTKGYYIYSLTWQDWTYNASIDILKFEKVTDDPQPKGTAK